MDKKYLDESKYREMNEDIAMIGKPMVIYKDEIKKFKKGLKRGKKDFNILYTIGFVAVEHSLISEKDFNKQMRGVLHILDDNRAQKKFLKELNRVKK